MLLITRVIKFLNEVDFPAMRDEMLQTAIEVDAEEEVIAKIADLPYDLYNSKEEVLNVIFSR